MEVRLNPVLRLIQTIDKSVGENECVGERRKEARERGRSLSLKRRRVSLIVDLAGYPGVLS